MYAPIKAPKKKYGDSCSWFVVFSVVMLTLLFVTAVIHIFFGGFTWRNTEIIKSSSEACASAASTTDTTSSISCIPLSSGAPCSCTTQTQQYNSLTDSLATINNKVSGMNSTFQDIIQTLCAVQFYSVGPSAPNLTCPFLAGKNVLVTGASRGLGRATALRFVALGMNVYGTSRNWSIVADPPAGVVQLPLEYADDNSIDSLVQYFVTNNITLHLLYGNGATGNIGFSRWMTEAEVEYVTRSAFSGHVKLQRRILPVMPTTGYARIMETVSLSAYLPGGFGGAYDAAKAALLGHMANEDLACRATGSNLRYVSIHPGQMNTTIFDHAIFGTNRPTSLADPDFKFAVAFNVTLKNALLTAGASPDWVAQAVTEAACNANPPTEVFSLYPPGFTSTMPGFENPYLTMLGFFNIRIRQGAGAFATLLIGIMQQVLNQLFP